MTQPITNNFTITNQDNYNLSLQEKPAEFSGFKVFATNPTRSIQDKAETFKMPQTIQINLGDRSSTPANNLNTIIIKPFNDFSNENEMLYYFYNIIDSIYKSYNIEINPNITEYIPDRTSRPFRLKQKMNLYVFWCSVTKFTAIFLATNNHNIFDIISVLFYKTNNRFCIKNNLKKFFVSATDDQIQKFAENKNFYKFMSIKKQSKHIKNFDNEKFIIESIREDNKEKEKIYECIHASKADEPRKYLIQDYVTKLFQICLIKDINIDNHLIIIIKSLLNLKPLTNDTIKQILERIIFFFNCFDTRNAIADTSIFTSICCSSHFIPTRLLLSSVCNITNEQMQFITSCKNKFSILQSWIFKGFPSTGEINEIINNYKKNNTDDKRIKHVITASTSYSKPQPDIIDLTKTEDSYSETIVLDLSQADSDDRSKEIVGNTGFDNEFAEWLHRPTDYNKEDLDGASKKIDDIVKDIQNNPHKQTTNDNENYDELWNLVKDLSDNSTFTAMNPDDAPNGLPEPNNTNESSLEHSPNKIPRLS